MNLNGTFWRRKRIYKTEMLIGKARNNRYQGKKLIEYDIKEQAL